MKANNKYFFNGDALYIVKNNNITSYKLTKLNILSKKVVELGDHICNILITYDFIKIPKNKLIVDKKTIDDATRTIGVLSNLDSYSFLFSYLYYLDIELVLLEGKKYIKNMILSKYENVVYDDENIYQHILTLI